MKLSLSLLAYIMLPVVTIAQELVRKTSFKDIEYVSSITWQGQNIYCSGTTYRTKYDDGYSTNAYLINYNLSLKPQWTLKLADHNTSDINSVIRHQDRIYALVSQGKSDRAGKDIILSLYVIRPDGSIEKKVTIGKTFYTPTNISIEGKQLVFGHTTKEGRDYTSPTIPELIRYDLATGKITRNKGSQVTSAPKRTITSPKGIFQITSHLLPGKPNIISLRNGSYSELSLNAPKKEYFLDSYLNGNILTVVCTFPGVYGDMQQYLKYYYLDLSTNKVTSKAILLADLGWKRIRFSAANDGNASWLTVEEASTKTVKYVLVDSKGTIKKTMKFDISNGDNDPEHFITEQDQLLKASSNGIYLYRNQ